MKRRVAYLQVRRIQVKAKSLGCVRLFATPCTVTTLLHPWDSPARLLEWVAISFSRASSRPRDQTWVSRIAGRRFNLWATREAPKGWWDVKVAQSCLTLWPHGLCCCCCCWVASVVSDSVRLHRRQPTRLLCARDSLKNTGVGCHFLLHQGLYSPWNSTGQNTGVGSLSLLQGIFRTRVRTQGQWGRRGVVAGQGGEGEDSLSAEPPGKPKNTGVGSLSLLQGIFLTQESNQVLLHCRWILYQLSYEGSPVKVSSRALPGEHQQKRLNTRDN